MTLLKIKGIMTALAQLKVSNYAFMQNHDEECVLLLPGAEKLLFPEEKLFSKGNKYSQRSFLKLGIMFSAYIKRYIFLLFYCPRTATDMDGTLHTYL